MEFEVEAPFGPMGDQPGAIAALTERIRAGEKCSVLLGVTGSGKTYSVAKVIEAIQKPTLVISHNKTLAAQLFSEFRQFFPRNAVEYFVSYFDYYQPEAYMPQTDTYIEKDSSINEEIERLRLSATSSLLTRSDVLVVASVSCIYGLGSPDDYAEMLVSLEEGQEWSRDDFLARLVEIQYERNDMDLERGKFRVRGDVVELGPAYREDGIRIEFFGDEVERIQRIDPLTGDVEEELKRVVIFPARHFVTPRDKMMRAIDQIKVELQERIAQFEDQKKLLEAQRLKMRTMNDIEMMQEMGFCNGIENYSRYMSGRQAGERPGTLIDFFPDDFLCVVDESHATLPQVRGMFEGDRARKTVLVEHGFRLPSALDNRPLNYPEFEKLVPQLLCVSATPGDVELNLAGGHYAEQVIRPTGLLDPEVHVYPLKGQIDRVITEVRRRAERRERVLVTTLTKRTAEDLTDYLRDAGIRVQYIHAEVDAIERVEILRDLRAGEFDVLVGINLLREGLDLPEVSLVMILDADKEGYLRSETSLIQTAGRAARHVNGEVMLFADRVTRSMKRLMEVTEYRRARQMKYNREHSIEPRTVRRAIQESLHTIIGSGKDGKKNGRDALDVTDLDVQAVIKQLSEEMMEASQQLEFEKAALLRDQIEELKQGDGGSGTAAGHGKGGGKATRYRGKGRRTRARP